MMAWVLKKLKSVAEVTRFAKTNATDEANGVPKTNATEVSGVSQTDETEAEISSPSEIKKKIFNGDHPQLPNQCPHMLKKLIEDCWSFEASHRPTFGEICAQLRHIKCGTFMPYQVKWVHITRSFSIARSFSQEFNLKCRVCNHFCPQNGAQWLAVFCTHPFWNMKYCPEHERDGTPRCCSCERLENKVEGEYVALEDGRRVCLECLESIVVHTQDCQLLFCGILNFYKDMGMSIEQDIPVLLIQRTAINAADSLAGEVQGICISEEQTEPAVFQGDSSNPMRHMRTGNQKLTRHCEVTAIRVLYGLPRLLTGSILASLLMHAWLRLQGTYPHLRPEVELGLRSVMSHTWLTSELKKLKGKRSSSSPNNGEISVEARLGEFYLHKIETDPSPDWFCLARDSLQKFGLSRVLEHLQRTGNFP